MRVSKKLFFFLIIGICVISLNVNAVSADDQICFKLFPPPDVFGGGPHFLKLGLMNFGNYHVAVSGTEREYVYPGHSDAVYLVHGNAEIVNGMVEVALTAAGMSSDNKTSGTFSYHLRLDMTTLSGAYTRTFPGSTVVIAGPVSVVPCSDNSNSQ